MEQTWRYWGLGAQQQGLLVRQVTENCFNWTAIHNTFNFAHQGCETFVVVDLPSEEGLQNFPHGANAALPYTTDM